jgi:hypothetical protein
MVEVLALFARLPGFDLLFVKLASKCFTGASLLPFGGRCNVYWKTQ